MYNGVKEKITKFTNVGDESFQPCAKLVKYRKEKHKDSHICKYHDLMETLKLKYCAKVNGLNTIIDWTSIVYINVKKVMEVLKENYLKTFSKIKLKKSLRTLLESR